MHIDIGNLLDACGISYTDKQLAKLDKLFDELLKKLILQQYDFDETPQQHDSNLDFEQNACILRTVGNTMATSHGASFCVINGGKRELCYFLLCASCLYNKELGVVTLACSSNSKK